MIRQVHINKFSIFLLYMYVLPNDVSKIRISINNLYKNNLCVKI